MCPFHFNYFLSFLGVFHRWRNTILKLTTNITEREYIRCLPIFQPRTEGTLTRGIPTLFLKSLQTTVEPSFMKLGSNLYIKLRGVDGN